MATNISRALLLSATANTATPFLYQTRTLSPVLRSFQRPCTPRLRQSYSTRSSDLESNDDLESNASSERSNSETGTSHEIRKNHLRKRGSSASRHSESSDKFKSVTSKERAAFNRLLAQLNNEMNTEEAASQTKPQQNAKQNDITELMKLFGGIINGDAQKKPKPEQSSLSTPTHNNIETSDNLVDDLHSETSNELAEDEEMPLNEAIYSREELGLPPTRSGSNRLISMKQAVALVVQRETYGIERALFEAIEGNKGDMAVWEVCKSHIFSMLRYMEGQASTTPSTQTGDENAPETSATTSSSNNAVMIPPMIPAGLVISTLYPRALLMAFRLLNTHFPESQLISQFRASIKAQGRTSAILGASPELYHEMVHFYWHGCRDLPAVMSFLRDMDLHGVPPSRETLSLLRDIDRQGRAHLKPRKGSDESGQGSSPFWDLPPNQKALAELSEKGGWLGSYKRTKKRGTSKIPPHRKAF